MNEDTFECLKERLGGFTPDTAVVLGSGLGGLVSALKEPAVIPYAEIPGFPVPTVTGHAGRFYAGSIGRHSVLCLQGRVHLYEGISPRVIDDIVRLLKNLGIKQLIVTNAAGSLNTSLEPGSLMLIKDHINLSGANPLTGLREEPYFPDMSNAYDENLRRLFLETAEEENIPVSEGVYLMVSGPNYETKSEVRLFASFGADAVGMSTVPEVISAVHKGIKVLGVSVISNFGAGLTDKPQNHAEVLQKAGQAADRLGHLIQKFLERN